MVAPSRLPRRRQRLTASSCCQSARERLTSHAWHQAMRRYRSRDNRFYLVKGASSAASRRELQGGPRCGWMPMSAMPVATDRRMSWTTQADTPERWSRTRSQSLHASALKTLSPLRGNFSRIAPAVGEVEQRGPACSSAAQPAGELRIASRTSTRYRNRCGVAGEQRRFRLRRQGDRLRSFEIRLSSLFERTRSRWPVRPAVRVPITGLDSATSRAWPRRKQADSAEVENTGPWAVAPAFLQLGKEVCHVAQRNRIQRPGR